MCLRAPSRRLCHTQELSTSLPRQHKPGRSTLCLTRTRPDLDQRQSARNRRARLRLPEAVAKCVSSPHESAQSPQDVRQVPLTTNASVSLAQR